MKKGKEEKGQNAEFGHVAEVGGRRERRRRAKAIVKVPMMTMRARGSGKGDSEAMMVEEKQKSRANDERFKKTPWETEMGKILLESHNIGNW